MNSECPRFFVLRNRFFGNSGLVSHVSLTGFGVLVSYTSEPLIAILFPYDVAQSFLSLLASKGEDTNLFEILPFPC